MPRRFVFVAALCCSALIGVLAFAQEKGGGQGKGKAGKAANTEPPLAWRNDWKPVAGLPVEHPIDQQAVGNANLEMHLWGPSGKDIVENGIVDNYANPMHLWTGLCVNVCGLSLRDKNNYVDMSGLGKIKWLTKVSGLHQVHAVIKLADGTWLLSEHADGSVFDYHATEFTLSETRWIAFDPEKVVTHGRWLEKVDLSKVDEVGFTDLMPGSGHGDGGYSGLGWIEVYGKPVPRNP